MKKIILVFLLASFLTKTSSAKRHESSLEKYGYTFAFYREGDTEFVQIWKTMISKNDSVESRTDTLKKTVAFSRKTFSTIGWENGNNEYLIMALINYPNVERLAATSEETHHAKNVGEFFRPKMTEKKFNVMYDEKRNALIEKIVERDFFGINLWLIAFLFGVLLIILSKITRTTAGMDINDNNVGCFIFFVFGTVLLLVGAYQGCEYAGLSSRISVGVLLVSFLVALVFTFKKKRLKTDRVFAT